MHFRMHMGFPGGGPAVHAELVVANRSGNGFETVTLDNGTVKSVNGDQLTITEGTVKVHLQNIYQKLHVTGRREAVARSYALGILPATAPSPGSGPGGPPAPYLDRRQA